MNKPSYYIAIPSRIRYDKNLSCFEKLLYGEISLLCARYGYCWASNAYFANIYSVSIEAIKKSITHLVNLEYIRREVKQRNKRTLAVLNIDDVKLNEQQIDDTNSVKLECLPKSNTITRCVKNYTPITMPSMYRCVKNYTPNTPKNPKSVQKGECKKVPSDNNIINKDNNYYNIYSIFSTNVKKIELLNPGDSVVQKEKPNKKKSQEITNKSDNQNQSYNQTDVSENRSCTSLKDLRRDVLKRTSENSLRAFLLKENFKKNKYNTTTPGSGVNQKTEETAQNKQSEQNIETDVNNVVETENNIVNPENALTNTINNTGTNTTNNENQSKNTTKSILSEINSTLNRNNSTLNKRNTKNTITGQQIGCKEKRVAAITNNTIKYFLTNYNQIIPQNICEAFCNWIKYQMELGGKVTKTFIDSNAKLVIDRLKITEEQEVLELLNKALLTQHRTLMYIFDEHKKNMKWERHQQPDGSVILIPTNVIGTNGRLLGPRHIPKKFVEEEKRMKEATEKMKYSCLTPTEFIEQKF